MLVIGLGHKARNGKDTFAKFLLDANNGKYNAKSYSFAKELKEEVNQLYTATPHGWVGAFELLRHRFNLPEWVYNEENGESWDVNDPYCPYGKQRTLLQWWGSEYRREQSPNYWVKKIDARLKEEKPDIAILTDMRFPNEAAWVKSFGRDGITINVKRTGFSSGVNAHISETALDDFEYDVVVEAGTLAELKYDADDFFQYITERDVIPDGFIY